MLNFIEFQDLSKEDFPLTHYFLDTVNEINPKNAFEWIEKIDDNALEILSEYVKILLNDDNEVYKNSGSKTEDFMSVAWCLTSIESGRSIENLTKEEINEMGMALTNYTMIEALKRKGIVDIKGGGSIYDLENNMTISLTENGQLVQDGMETLYDIAGKIKP